MIHQKARERIVRRIQDADTPERRDEALDELADGLLRATEWDADQWGFDPGRWMEKERVALASRGGQDYPREAGA